MRHALWIGLALCLAACSSEVRYSPGVLVDAEPVQERLQSAPVFQVDGHIVRPLARFQIDARVLSTERYRFDRGAALSPVDLALGWGPMSDQSVLDQIEISQSGRFYRWRVQSYPIPRGEIISHSANMHMIPANEEIRDELLSIRPGDVVSIEGYLVAATSESGWTWKSSLRRTDSGNGACEVVWVERLLVRPPDIVRMGL